MATKTDRILSYLPGTFRALPRPTALYTLVNAFGTELLHGENSLAALMQAHWVDHADRNSEIIDDLVRIAALYGLAPRPDESVEEFREHIKRYIRIFLEGTVTVQGILRVTAQALALRIADDYQDLDTWWTRGTDALVTVAPRGDDAAGLLFGTDDASAAGSPAQPAQIVGTVDLSGGVDLQENHIIKLTIDQTATVEINLITDVGNPAMVRLKNIVQAINAIVPGVAQDEDAYLVLTSTTTGPDSYLEVHEVENDAAALILGLAPRAYHGRTMRPAAVTGLVDLAGGIDLTVERYLRLFVDGMHLAEIDCAGPDPNNTTLDEIRDAINLGLGLEMATHDGHFLKLESRTTGFSSSIGFQRAAAGDAKDRLFGSINALHIGQDEQPARIRGSRDLSGGVDLSEHFNIRVLINETAPVTINCAGADPANTQLPAIVAAINGALGAEMASQNGRFVTLQSPTTGPDSFIAFGTPNDDATEPIFGIVPRKFCGREATAAHIIGATLDLNEDGVLDVSTRRFIKLAVDGAPTTVIDLPDQLHQKDKDPRSATPGELADAMNAAVGAMVVSHVGDHLELTSPSTGSASHLELEPIEDVFKRRYVTRAAITDEANQAVFGFVAREAEGTPATNARVIGKPDLSHGVDLRESPYIRLAVDNKSPVDINCAGARPRATLIHEVVKKINSALGVNVASHDNRHLVLVSPSFGTDSQIAFETPRARDALDTLLVVDPGTFRGRDATRVTFIGTVDLSGGVDLSGSDRIKLGIDGADAIEISCAGSNPVLTKLNEIVIAINMALDAVVANHDGTHLIMTSLSSGEGSQIVFESPSSADATSLLFGFDAPRTYQGDRALAAQVIGQVDLRNSINLVESRFLQLIVNGQTFIVDCTSRTETETAVALAEIIEAIKEEAGEAVASSPDGAHLVLTAPTVGSSSRIVLEPYTTGDARSLLFGADVPAQISGDDPGPAVITGEADLLSPVGLSERGLIRLSVNGGRPVDIDVAGAAPAATFMDEIVDAINVVFPDMASRTEDDRLRLTSPGTDLGSHLALLPLRYLELIEYPPEFNSSPVHRVQHGGQWTIVNKGIANVNGNIQFTAPQGAFGVGLVNLTIGWRVRLLTVTVPSGRVCFKLNNESILQVEIHQPDGVTRLLSGEEIIAGPLGAQAVIPTQEAWFLRRGIGGDVMLQLNNPQASAIVMLRARQPAESDVAVTVVESDIDVIPEPDASALYWIGRIRKDESGYRLVGTDEKVVAALRSGIDIDLVAYIDRVVTIAGVLHSGEPPLIVIHGIAGLFDVSLWTLPKHGDSIKEEYKAVTIGVGEDRNDSLVRRTASGPAVSQLVKASELAKATILTLPKGKSDWLYMECESSRFNEARFDHANFAGGACTEEGIFDVSQFAADPSHQSAPQASPVAVFAPSNPAADRVNEIEFGWSAHQPGSLVVNLPADLPARFGGRFNEARFGQGLDSPERFPGAVTEPADDELFLVTLIENGNKDLGITPSGLVIGKVVPFVPLGWEAVTMPFRNPQHLTLGRADALAKIYLAEEGLNGFIEIAAREVGVWGNEIAITARRAGPAMYDVSIVYQGAIFENARQVVMGKSLAVLTSESLTPGPIGILQAKSAGVRAVVTRDRTKSTESNLLKEKKS